MKTKTITVREGELLGPIDGDFDFEEFYKPIYPAECNGQEAHEEHFRRAMTILRMIEKDPDKYEATTYGGWPRCGWGSTVHIGMYDGWPWWRPIPSVYIQSWSGGGEWHSFHNITDIRLKGEYWPLKIPDKPPDDLCDTCRYAVGLALGDEYHPPNDSNCPANTGGPHAIPKG